MKRLFTLSQVESPDDVRKSLADPDRHWREGYSACELATSWVKANDFPASVRNVMEKNPIFNGARLIEAFFEKKVELETPGRPSQNDILVYAKLNTGFAAIAVEGKVRESFDKYVCEKPKTPGVAKRIENLCDRLGLSATDVQTVRYQLLHRTVSAVMEAERYFAEHALMLVHSFDPDNSSFEDYRNFAKLMGFAPELIVPNEIVGHKQLREVKVHLGWVRDAPFARQRQVGVASDVTQEQDRIASVSSSPAGDTSSLERILRRIKDRSDVGIGKASSVVSSNISSDFKKQTRGLDYKSYYDPHLRSQIARIGAQFGVPIALIVNLVVEIKDESVESKGSIIEDVLRGFG